MAERGNSPSEWAADLHGTKEMRAYCLDRFLSAPVRAALEYSVLLFASMLTLPATRADVCNPTVFQGAYGFSLTGNTTIGSTTRRVASARAAGVRRFRKNLPTRHRSHFRTRLRQSGYGQVRGAYGLFGDMELAGRFGSVPALRGDDERRWGAGFLPPDGRGRRGHGHTVADDGRVFPIQLRGRVPADAIGRRGRCELPVWKAAASRSAARWWRTAAAVFRWKNLTSRRGLPGRTRWTTTVS